MKAKLIMMSMLGGICGFTACQETSKRAQQSAAEQADKTAIIQHYSKLVHLTYTDCLHTAKELDNPSASTQALSMTKKAQKGCSMHGL